ncbi:MAG TPA: cytochrome c oxidase assembly protein, partial [Pseudomonas sp.]|nr:cytochrome c oxidase assembly protein [Pseudomonas sp.]
MTRIQKTVFILVALVALVIGLTVYKVLNTEQQLDTA